MSGWLFDRIYHLKEEFGLLKQYRDGNYFISLIFLNLHEPSLQKLCRIEYRFNDVNIVVDKIDPTIFLFKNEQYKRICKIVTKTIIIGDVIGIGFYLDYFYDKCVYSIR
jgi:hypothetical protein